MPYCTASPTAPPAGTALLMAAIGTVAVGVAVVAFTVVLRSQHGARTVGRWADRLVNPLTRRLAHGPQGFAGVSLLGFAACLHPPPLGISPGNLPLERREESERIGENAGTRQTPGAIRPSENGLCIPMLVEADEADLEHEALVGHFDVVVSLLGPRIEHYDEIDIAIRSEHGLARHRREATEKIRSAESGKMLAVLVDPFLDQIANIAHSHHCRHSELPSARPRCPQPGEAFQLACGTNLGDAPLQSGIAVVVGRATLATLCVARGLVCQCGTR